MLGVGREDRKEKGHVRDRWRARRFNARSAGGGDRPTRKPLTRAPARHGPGPPGRRHDPDRLREARPGEEDEPHGSFLGPRPRHDPGARGAPARARGPLPARDRPAGRRGRHRLHYRAPGRPAASPLAAWPLPRPRPPPRRRHPPPSRPLARSLPRARSRPRRSPAHALLLLRDRARARHRRLGGTYAALALDHLESSRGGPSARALRHRDRRLDGFALDGFRARLSRGAHRTKLRARDAGVGRPEHGLRGVVRVWSARAGSLSVLVAAQPAARGREQRWACLAFVSARLFFEWRRALATKPTLGSSPIPADGGVTSVPKTFEPVEKVGVRPVESPKQNQNTRKPRPKHYKSEILGP